MSKKKNENEFSVTCDFSIDDDASIATIVACLHALAQAFVHAVMRLTQRKRSHKDFVENAYARRHSETYDSLFEQIEHASLSAKEVAHLAIESLSHIADSIAVSTSQSASLKRCRILDESDSKAKHVEYTLVYLLHRAFRSFSQLRAQLREDFSAASAVLRDLNKSRSQLVKTRDSVDDDAMRAQIDSMLAQIDQQIEQHEASADV